jgi:protein phosphatase
MIPIEQAHLRVAALSHPGETGKNNEDRFSVVAQRLGSRGLPGLLAVVADGIGGHQAGEVASQITVDTIVRRLEPSNGRSPLAELRNAVVEAARAVSRASAEAEERRGMGSTVAVAWVLADRLFTATIGDSRIYLLRQGILRQLSVDHTWIQEALDHNVISPEEAREHPNAHILRRHLGGEQVPEPDLRMRLAPGESEQASRSHQGLRLRGKDQILLCSDGLTDLVTDHEIRETLTAHPPPEAVETLVQTARGRGGHDNITIVVMGVPPRPQPDPRRQRGRFLAASAIGILALLAIFAVAGAAAWWFGLWPW